MRLRFDPEPDVCPTAAFEPDELAWPRVVRRAFSDPRVPHESTGVHGRGTEEVKTNDVSGRVNIGRGGFTIEFGRPGVGVRFRDIQKMCWALAQAGVAFEKKNPVTSLMSDVATGTIREDILDEKVLSAIVEIKVPSNAHRRNHPPGLGRSKSGSTPWSRWASACAATKAARKMWSRRCSKSSATNWSAPKPTSASAASPTLRLSPARETVGVK
jgi:hypothetical protein